MKRLSDLEMMDYLDGTLAPERVAAVEAHLAADAEDAQLLADLKLAQSTLHEMAQEPIRARDDFWQKVKAELPAERRSFAARLASFLAPPQRKVGMSLGLAAAVVAIVTMIATFFGPGQTQAPTFADNTVSQALTQQQKAELEGRVPPKRDAKPLPGAASSNSGAESDN